MGGGRSRLGPPLNPPLMLHGWTLHFRNCVWRILSEGERGRSELETVKVLHLLYMHQNATFNKSEILNNVYDASLIRAPWRAANEKTRNETRTSITVTTACKCTKEFKIKCKKSHERYGIKRTDINIHYFRSTACQKYIQWIIICMVVQRTLTVHRYFNLQ